MTRAPAPEPLPEVALQGEYFAPGSSRAYAATLRLWSAEGQPPQAVLVRDRGTEPSSTELDRTPLPLLVIEPPLVGLPRRIVWPSGGAFVTPDHAGAAALAAARQRVSRRSSADLVRQTDSLVTRLESKWSLALGALALTVLFAAWAVLDGVPRAAQALAARTPPDVLRQLDQQTFTALEDDYLAESTLPAERQQQLQQLFKQTHERLDPAGQTYHYRLALRDGGETIGANAFALPGGTIMMTDQLVEQIDGSLDADLAQQGLAGILAHELGHVQQRHSLAGIYQGLGLGILIAAATGDLVTSSSVAAAAPVFLIQQGYSRTAEYEADRIGGEYLLREYQTTKGLREALLSLEDDAAAEPDASDTEPAEAAEADSPAWQELLLTHPDTAHRIQRLLELE